MVGCAVIAQALTGTEELFSQSAIRWLDGDVTHDGKQKQSQWDQGDLLCPHGDAGHPVTSL
jgi:hypothetical protein